MIGIPEEGAMTLYWVINRIRYFTSKVRPMPSDPQQPQRQQIYLRALKTIPNLEIHYGTVSTWPALRPLANPPGRANPMARVMDTKEKGSDVNLASYLLMDGFRADYEMAAVLSNDSDLITPIALVRQELGLPVTLLCPQRSKKKVSRGLLRVASSYKPIREGALAMSQFPPIMSDAAGSFRKPTGW